MTSEAAALNTPTQAPARTQPLQSGNDERKGQHTAYSEVWQTAAI